MARALDARNGFRANTEKNPLYKYEDLSNTAQRKAQQGWIYEHYSLTPSKCSYDDYLEAHETLTDQNEENWFTPNGRMVINTEEN